MKYNPIGTTFKEGNVLLLVQESLGSLCTCTGCYYVAKDKNGHQIYRGSCCTHGHVCTPYYRKVDILSPLKEQDSWMQA